jgi:hypothetical protein
MKEKTEIKKESKIENFIGMYDNYITEEECNKAIKLFENQYKFNKTMNRQVFENASPLRKKDNQYFANQDTIDVWWDELKNMIHNFDIALQHYLKYTGAYENDLPLHYTVLKIQKTLPTEGYHVWHIEHGRGFSNEPRALVFSIYLNDVKEGGETEFLHQSMRVQPKKGRIVIWPAGFPYVHRGNPPLKGEKYFLTSWMTLR